jgi:hypothetical protein
MLLTIRAFRRADSHTLSCFLNASCGIRSLCRYRIAPIIATGQYVDMARLMTELINISDNRASSHPAGSYDHKRHTLMGDVFRGCRIAHLDGRFAERPTDWDALCGRKGSLLLERIRMYTSEMRSWFNEVLMWGELQRSLTSLLPRCHLCSSLDLCVLRACLRTDANHSCGHHLLISLLRFGPGGHTGEIAEVTAAIVGPMAKERAPIEYMDFLWTSCCVPWKLAMAGRADLARSLAKQLGADAAHADELLTELGRVLGTLIRPVGASEGGYWTAEAIAWHLKAVDAGKQ